MDLLKAEIERKRKATNALTTKIAGGEDASEKKTTIGSSRFMKQSDLIRMRQEELEEAQQRLDEEKEAKRRRFDDEQQEKNVVTGKKSNNHSSTTSTGEEKIVSTVSGSNRHEQSKSVDNGLSKLSDPQVKSRLRCLGHPITLFGENALDRVRRLAQVEKEHLNSFEDDEFRSNSSSSQSRGRQALLHRQSKAVQQEEEDFDEDDRNDNSELQVGAGNGQATSSSSSSRSRVVVRNDNDNDSDGEDDDDQEKGEQGARGSSGDTNYQRGFTADGKRIQFSKMPNLTPEKVVYKYFRSLLKEWEWDLNARDDAEKMTARGKMETKTQKQCKDYIRPLFKMCKRRHVEKDILDKLHEMVQCCDDGNFRAAHDKYLQTAIGNAAWPIGLTMVGIHERSGREKISTSKVAHVMNNELQRKYLTSVKRLMTYAQKKRPDVPPSMKVL